MAVSSRGQRSMNLQSSFLTALMGFWHQQQTCFLWAYMSFHIYFSYNVLSCVSGSRIGSEEAFYLYSSGPDLTSIMPCKYGKPRGSFSKFVSQESLKCEQMQEILMKNRDFDAGTLVVSMYRQLNFCVWRFLYFFAVKYKLNHYCNQKYLKLLYLCF